MPVWVQWVSFALAVVGSLSGLFALYLNFQRTTITKRVERERLEAKKKAKFRIEHGREVFGSGQEKVFYLHNFGENDAKNVVVKFYKEDENRVIKREVSPLYSKIPETINSGQKVKSVMGVDGKMNFPFTVVITWDDDFTNENELEEILS